MGRKEGDPRLADELNRVPFELGQDGGRIVYPLSYGGKDLQLSAEQLAAALLTKLKEIGFNALGSQV